MTISVAPALLLGLGGRILLDFLTRTEPSTFKANALVGCWQGIAIYYASRHNLVLPVAIGVSAKVFGEYFFAQDELRLALAILAIVLGFFGTDLLTAAIEQPAKPTSKSKKSSSSGEPRSSSRKHRSTTSGSNTTRSRSRRTMSDITSVDSSSEFLGPKNSMTPLEREVAALRTRASLADSERRRFKEEKKWAVEQGNLTLASQLSWQVKRYSALMKSFHREAEAKLVESSHARTRLEPIAEDQPSTSRSSDRRRTLNVDINSAKPAMRVNVR